MTAPTTSPSRPPGRRIVLIAVAVVAAVLVGAAVVIVVSRGDPDTERMAPHGDQPTSTPAATTEGAVPGLRFLPEDVPDDGSRAPLTGLPVPDPRTLGRPLLAIKVDNLDVPGETARPQTGLAFADVVVEEVVEGGITRFVLLLHSTDSPPVGPIRSARTTDVHLLPAFGTGLFAYSGGNPGVLAAVRAAPTIIDRGGGFPPAYVRVPDRRAPHDLFLRPEVVWGDPGAATPPRPLSDFRPRGEPASSGQPTGGVTIDHGGLASSPIRWEWQPTVRRWVRYQRGSVHVDGEGYAVGPRNVVVAFTAYGPSPADPRSPEAVTVGGGEAWILLDGKVVTGRWERPTEDSPFSLLDAAGRPVRLSAGRTWIELVEPAAAALLPRGEATG